MACVDIQAERTEATLAALKGSGHAAFVADVGDDASMQALADAVLAGFLICRFCTVNRTWEDAARDIPDCRKFFIVT